MKTIIKKEIYSILTFGLFVLLSSIGFIVGAYSLSNILNAAINKNIHQTTIQIIIVLCLFLIGAIFMQISAIFRAKLLMKFNNEMRIKITNKLITLDYKKYKSNSSGTYVSWYINDVNQIQNKVFESFLSIFESIINMIISLISILLLSWMVGIFSLGYTLMLIFIPKIFEKFLTKKSLKFSKEQGVFSQEISDKINGYDEFNNNNILIKFFNLINFASVRLEKSRYDYQIAETKHDSLIISINILGQFLAIFLSAIFAIKNYTNFGTILSITSLSGTFFISTRLSVSFGVKIFSNQKLIKKFDSPKYFNDLENIFEISNIKINNLIFKYDEKVIFSNFKLELFKNKKYLLIGKSGAGKSTLLKLIFGHDLNYQGEILFNDRLELKTINKNIIKQQIAYISQSSHIFNDTLRNNLTLYNESIKDDQIIDVLNKVNLSNWYNNLKLGLDEMIEDKSKNISSGEKQRILLARSLLQNKKIFFLDEATSNLDKTNAINIEKTILQFPDLTVVIINHNVYKENLKYYDKIIEL